MVLVKAHPEPPANGRPAGSIFELVVEDDPNAASPSAHRQTSCAWVARNDETGTEERAAITRHFDADGRLQAVELQLPLSGLPAPQPNTENDTPPETEKEPSHDEHENSMDRSGAPAHDLYAGNYEAVRANGPFL